LRLLSPQRALSEPVSTHTSSCSGSVWECGYFEVTWHAQTLARSPHANATPFPPTRMHSFEDCKRQFAAAGILLPNETLDSNVHGPEPLPPKQPSEDGYESEEDCYDPGCESHDTTFLLPDESRTAVGPFQCCGWGVGMGTAWLYVVGRYTLCPVHPYLESAWLQPSSLSSAEVRSRFFQAFAFKFQLAPLRQGCRRRQVPAATRGGGLGGVSRDRARDAKANRVALAI
jgi:hypothetical protein